MDGLQLFRRVASNFLHEDTISSLEEWRELMTTLCDAKIIRPGDMKSIDERLLVFPMKLTNLQSIISTQSVITVQAKGDPKFMQLLFDAEHFQEQLAGMKTTLNIWNERGMSQEETSQLIGTFQKVKEQIAVVQKRVATIHHNLSETSQQEAQVIDNLAELARLEKLEPPYASAQEYLDSELFVIEKHFANIRVREVHYRNQPIKVLLTKDSIVHQLGFNTKNDEPLEVVKVPRMYKDLYQLELMLTTFNAYKELLMSPYFRKFLGGNNHADPQFNLYFMDYSQAQPLTEILQQAKYRMNQDTALYQYWVREVFYGLRDLLFMTVHMPVLPIDLSAIYIGDKGLTVVLREVKFLRVRKGAKQSHKQLEARLLRNFGQLCLAFMGLEENNLEEIKSVEFRCFVKALLSAEKEYSRVEKGISNKHLTFSLCESAPMLTRKNIPDIEPCIILENWEGLLGKRSQP